MKFAKGLEENMVPEWRVKYLDYKGGKKRIKQVAKAFRYSQASPAVNSLYINSLFQKGPVPAPEPEQSSNGPLKWISSRIKGRRASTAAGTAAPAQGEPSSESASDDNLTPNPERSPLNTSNNWREHGEAAGSTQYGSIGDMEGLPPSLQLPEPMQPLDGTASGPSGKRKTGADPAAGNTGKRRFTPPAKSSGVTGFTKATSRPALLRRGLTHHRTQASMTFNGKEVNVGALRDEAAGEFFAWMEAELTKIDNFYRMKEEEAAQRLVELREQLHIMRDMRLSELRKTTRANSTSSGDGQNDAETCPQAAAAAAAAKGKRMNWNPVDALQHARFGAQQPSKSNIRTAEVLQRITTATSMLVPDLTGHQHQGHHHHQQHGQGNVPAPGNPRNSIVSDNSNEPSQPTFRRLTPGQRDYAHRLPTNEITYRVAKKKLKTAIIEYYRGLELLKSYCHQNREGLRKINKKFDKATALRTSKRFITEKVNTSYFGSSYVLEDIMQQTEDLFCRYFERGDRKHAVERLRTKEKNHEFYGPTFRSGVLLGLGCFAGIQGMVMGLESTRDPVVGEQNVYLLQLWAGFFLPLLFVLLFALNCRAWAKNKINYVFCFEFDTRHNLDFRQYLEIPSLLWFLMTVIFWLNFENFWPDKITPIQYPLIFLALCLAIIFAPFPILYHRSRRWFLYAHWRLLLSGLYPVEFRDFWLGDMLCSQTYTIGNIALFTCLYNRDWDQPGMCNSSHSRLLGFFTCLPGIWRLLQCFRRYHDTRNAFPHLANAGKYACTVLYYVSLSLWRIDRSEGYKALFIALGTVNAVYCSTWDLAMDWSLLNPYAPWPFLRQELGFKRPYLYYCAMILDPILRFNWVFYIIFARDIQHSTIVSFLISLSEVFRRWIWSFLRMENEHCTNVGNFRAYREIPLPYELPPQAPRLVFPPQDLAEVPPLHRSASLAPYVPPPTLPEESVAEMPYPTPPTPAASGRRRSLSAATLAGASGYPQQAAPSIIEEHPDLERQMTSASSVRYRGGRRRGSEATAVASTPAMRAINAVGSALARAHTQDFERRNTREVVGKTPSTDGEDDDDDDIMYSSNDENEDEPPTGRRASVAGTVIVGAGSAVGDGSMHQRHQRHQSTATSASRARSDIRY